MKVKRIAFEGTALIGFLIALGTMASAQEFRFRVEHDHAIGSCKGELLINKDGVEYHTDKKEHTRKWTYTDIEMIKLKSPRKLEILTYESARMKLGRDRTFEFKALDGEIRADVSDFLLKRLERPFSTTFVTSDEKPQYAIPARHRHSFGGDQGTLRIYTGGVAYESARSKSSRRWRWADIQSISRMGPYQFAITTYEPKLGGPTKTYNFDLKERMDDGVYDFVWSRIYKPTLPASPDVNQ